MLHLSPTSHELSRAQGTLVDDKEIRKVVKFLKDIAAPSFERSLMQVKGGMDSDEERVFLSENNSSASLQAAEEDPMFDRAVEIVIETKRGSVSLLQRRLAIGYTRASRLIDLMGIAGILSDHKGSVARDVLISIEEWDAMKDLVADDARQAEMRDPEDPSQEMMFESTDEVAGVEGEVEEEAPFGDDEPAAAVEVLGTLVEEEEEEEEEEYEEDEAVDEVEEDELDEDEEEDGEVVDEEEEEEEVEYEYVDEDGNPVDPEDVDEDEYEVDDADEDEEAEGEEEDGEDDEVGELEDEYEEEEEVEEAASR